MAGSVKTVEFGNPYHDASGRFTTKGGGGGGGMDAANDRMRQQVAAKTTTARVMDTNNRPAGRQKVTIERDADGLPMQAEYKGETYFRTGKGVGESLGKKAGAPAGTKMVEMRAISGGDRRLWASLDGKWIHED